MPLKNFIPCLFLALLSLFNPGLRSFSDYVISFVGIFWLIATFRLIRTAFPTKHLL